MKTVRPSKGSIMLLVLVFGGIFFILLASLISFVLAEHRALEALHVRTEARTIAEAGLEYYAWFLSHFPTDLTNGTGTAGPYVTSYEDAEGNPVGTYTLSIEGVSACGSTQAIDIMSVGRPEDASPVAVTLVARYATPSVASYATIVNDGSTGVNFGDIATTFPTLKTTAQSSGLYLPRFSSATSSPRLGYHLILNADGTVTVNKVTAVTTLRTVRPIDGSANFINDYTLIQSETNYTTLTPLPDCGLIFVEDNVWLEGTVDGKITIVVANVSEPGVIPEVVLRDDITYATTDGTTSLTVIGKHDILIAPDSPMDMTLDGVFVAQSGAFGRNYYYYPSGGCNGLYEPRNTLTILGTIVSNLPTSTLWTNGCGGSSNAGYQTNLHSVDLENATNPSPFTPGTSLDQRLVTWQEK